MNRKDFLAKMGMGAAFALTATCLGSCYEDRELVPIAEIDFTLDLTDPINGNLLENEGYIIRDRVVVARTMDGEFVAATQQCSHEGRLDITFRDNEWFCTAHSARFDLDGVGLNENGRAGLKQFNTELNGDLLRVFG